MNDLKYSTGYTRSFILGVLVATIGLACANPDTKRGKALFETQCASCHLVPDIQGLPRALWKNQVLPDMAARMGIKDSTYNPFESYTFDEQHAMLKSGIYNVAPSLSEQDWQLLRDYVLLNAPDSLNVRFFDGQTKKPLQFVPETVDIDSSRGSFIVYLDIDLEKARIMTADMRGSVSEYKTGEKKLETKWNDVSGSITSLNFLDSSTFITTVGRFDPSEIAAGKVYSRNDTSQIHELPFDFHRPVHTLVRDFNGDGKEEIVVSEFGNLTGSLSLTLRNKDSTFNKKILLNQPGTVRSVARDMNGDGKEDIVAMTSQGDEGITILYQSGSLNFRAEQVIRFSPLYGSSWFELLDYDGDGDQDIITVHGDNADKTQILKPYHGLRIHLNDGSNNFSEEYFYPFHGATRSVSRDFDQDGDIDIAMLSTFPDYRKSPINNFVFLENKNSSNFAFEEKVLPEELSGRWFLMDAGDVDGDNDDDIVLSSFTYTFTNVPRDISKKWQDTNFDMLILKNPLKESKE